MKLKWPFRKLGQSGPGNGEALVRKPVSPAAIGIQDLPAAAADRVEKERTGWVSPSYTQSRTARLNPGFIADQRCVGFLPNAPELEFYRVLRTKILHRMGKGGNTLMVTSALPGEGKTLTAINLSLTLAKEFERTVLLVDCDLKQHGIQRTLGIQGQKGLADYLLNGCPLRELIVWPGVEKMTLISGERTVEGASELLGSPKMKELVTEMKTRYPDRLVIFDVPPVLAAADALVFAPFVDYVLLVVRAGKTPVHDIQKAIQMLPREKIVGTVLNRCEVGSTSYYYYSQYHSQEPASPPDPES